MAVKRNSYKKEEKAPAAKPGKKKKKAAQAGPIGKQIKALKALIGNEKLHRIAGLSMILFSVYLLIAFISFLFTWKGDQDKLSDSWMTILLNSDLAVENWLGKLGALVSHQFIHNWFGVASFLFILILFVIGFRILTGISLIPLRKTFRHALFGLVWISVTLGYLFDEGNLFLGGAFGYQVNSWLVGIVGSLGTACLLLFILSSYSIMSFDLSWIKPVMSRYLFKEGPEAELAGAGGGTVLADEEEDDDDWHDVIPGEAENKPIDLSDEPETAEAPAESKPADGPGELEIETGGDLDIELPSGDAAMGAAGMTAEPAATAATPDLEVPANNESGSDLEVTPPAEEPAISLGTENTAPASEATEEGDLGLEIEASKPTEEVLTDEQIEETIENKLDELGEYDPTLDLGEYQFPSIDLLAEHGDGHIQIDREELEMNKNRIVETLGNYKIGISKIKATIGPTVTLYEIVPEAGVRISKIKNLEDDIALSLAALGIRIIAPIPGKGTIGIEVPNSKPQVVSMKSVVASDKFQNADMALPVVLGKTISNETFVTDLAKMPHLLMAGATGQGKSVGLNAILVSLLYQKHPAQCKLVLVDPKKVELTLFNKIERHYLAALPDAEEVILTDTSKVVNTVNSLCVEMDARYELLKEAQCRNLKEYNKKFIQRRLNPEKGHRYLPYIVLVVDEFADLIMTAGKEIETPIARLAQLARAIGIHLIIATQRPSVNIITGTIKANFPSRIAFRVTSKIDSRTILDAGGAEQLIGRGDMLFSNGNDLVRLQCAFVDTPEVEEICNFIGAQRGYSNYHELPEYVDPNASGPADIDEEDRDVMFEEAARIVVMHQQGSASLLQRKLKLGYNRAGRIVDQLEAAGIIGPFEGSKARQVLVPDEVSLERYLNPGAGSSDIE